MSSNKIFIGSVLIVLTALFFLTKNTQGTGDDFALYLQQSQLFFKGENWQQNYFIFNKEDAIYSPKAYSMGYPVLLYPIWFFPLKEILVAKYFQIICLGLLMFVLFYLGKSKLKDGFFIFLYPFLAAGLFIIAGAVENILPDIWVVALGCLTILIIQSNQHNSIASLIFVGGLYFVLFWLKPVGIVYLWSAIVFHLYRRVREKDKKANRYITTYLSVFLGFYALISILGLQDESGSTHFINLVKQQNMRQNIASNAIIYKNEVLALIGTLGHGAFFWFTKPMSYCFVLMCLIGLVDSYRKDNRADLIFMVGMCFTILLFPNAKQGIRYFLPLLPFFLLYVLRGAEKILKQNVKWTAPILSLLVCIIVYDIHLKNSKSTFNICDEEVVAMYREVEQIVPKEEQILCAKPRLMGFMTKRKAGRVPVFASDDTIASFMDQESIQWIFVSRNMPHEAIDRIVIAQQQNLTVSKEFKRGTLYRLMRKSDFN